MFCEFCGTEIKNDSLFCKNCGERLKANTATSDIEEHTLSIGDEISKNKILFIIPFIYLLCHLVRRYVLLHTELDSSLISDIAVIGNIVFWGAFAYAVQKRTSKFVLCFMLPHLVYDIIWPFMLGTFQYMGEYSDFVEWISGMILPFALWGLLRSIKKIAKDSQKQRLIGFVYVLVTSIMLFINLIAWYLSACIETGRHFQLPISNFINYFGVTFITYMVMHIIYPEYNKRDYHH